MSNTLLNKYFAWFTACMSDCDTFGCIVGGYNCDTLLWAMIFVGLCGKLWALKILCFSLWNSPVTTGRDLLSEELECGHEESRRNVLLE